MNDPSEPRFGTGRPPTEELRHYPGPLSSIGITFGAVIAAGIVASMFGRQPDFGAIGVGQVVGFGLVAILATQNIPEPHAERLGLRGFDPQFIWVLVLLLPSLFLMSEADNIIRDLMPPPPPIDPEIERELESHPLFAPSFYGEIQRFIVVVGLAPVMEEWLFRGVIQQGLMGSLGRFRGLVLTAMLFALCRLVPGLPPSTLVSFLMVSLATGLLLGCVRIATGSLFAVILLHTGFNAVSWAAGFYAEDWPIDGFNVPDSHTSFQILAPALIATGYGLMALKRALKEAPPDPPLHPPRHDA
jgi:membrane protease YdiL (CAAX protease family)